MDFVRFPSVIIQAISSTLSTSTLSPVYKTKKKKRNDHFQSPTKELPFMSLKLLSTILRRVRYSGLINIQISDSDVHFVIDSSCHE